MTKITSQIKLIGGVLSLIIAFIVLITIYINHTSTQDSLVINVAGKQRMLTQKMTKEVFWLQHHSSDEYTTLNRSIEEFDHSLDDLINGNGNRGIYAPPKPSIAEQLHHIHTLWKDFTHYLNTFKALLQKTRTLKEKVPEASEHILNISDNVVKVMVKEKLEGSYIDDAGRQRMLTQKIAFHLSQYLINGQSEHITSFFHAFALYKSTLERFLHTQALMDLPKLNRVLTDNQTAWYAYSAYIIDLMDKQRSLNQTLLKIKDINVVLLNAMDNTVNAYTAYSSQRHKELQLFQYIASVIALLFMLYSAYLIRKIEENFSDFLKHSKAMATSFEDETDNTNHHNADLLNNNDELTLASMHMSYFVDNINTVIQHAQQAINESEKAARELEAVSQQIDGNLDNLQLDEASKKDIDKTIDTSEDIVIQTLEELSNTSQLLNQLQHNLSSVVEKTQRKTSS